MRNSVEARAKEVACDSSSCRRLRESPFPSIRVQDDGEGMTEKDLHLVGEFGCTSKPREEWSVGGDCAVERESADRDQEEDGWWV